ncbi:unnamed protein product, partial [Closterium sp. NIES-54]
MAETVTGAGQWLGGEEAQEEVDMASDELRGIKLAEGAACVQFEEIARELMAGC